MLEHSRGNGGCVFRCPGHTDNGVRSRWKKRRWVEEEEGTDE